jgi:hypothetical protein
MRAKLVMAKYWLGATGTPATLNLRAVSEPEADRASECIQTWVNLLC